MRNRTVSTLLDIVFPPTCAGCGVSGTWLCAECRATSRTIATEHCCLRCGYPFDFPRECCDRCASWTPTLLSCRSVFGLVGAPRRAVHLLKYSNERARAEWCATEILCLMRQSGLGPGMFIPIPLHASRLAQRGYNQSELICAHLVKMTGWRTLNALIRIRSTESQVGLPADARSINLLGAIAPRLPLSGEDIILVDDVVTTGSTLSAATVACRRAGAGSVRAVTFATDL